MRREGEAGGGSESKALVEFLKTKRWFGDKGREIRRAGFLDEIAVTWPNSNQSFSVARVRVETDAGDSVYQVFLDGSDANGKRVKEALDAPEFLRGLADAWVTGASFQQGNTRWTVRSETAKPLVVPPMGKIQLSSGEQTNSSVIINDQAILKLYRKLEPGIHPDVEVTRFLTIERQFVNVPALLGTIRFEDPAGTTVAGMLQEFVPGAIDAWTHVVDDLKAFSAANDAERWKGFDEEIAQLGAITRAMHEHLASGERRNGFGMERATGKDLDAWIAGARRTIDSTGAAIERALADGRIPRESERHARRVVSELPRTVALLERTVQRAGTDIGASIRTHGDYHLGQVLRSSAGQFLVIDFEGEPARPLLERRARTSPLRDVAGMLRSFAYAAAVAAMRDDTPGEDRDATVRHNYHRMRERFLAGYHREDGLSGLLPASDGDLLELFALEKQFYEVQYELDHRPDWLWVPLHDLQTVMES
jgi:trehalose synthase-fused probable maltokinase